MTVPFDITWSTLHKDTQLLAQQLSEEVASSSSFVGIIAVTRGGLVPAGIVANELNIRLIDTICIKSYSEDNQLTSNQIFKMPEHDGTGWLIIEDLVDTGGTFKTLRKHFPNARYACVYAKPKAESFTDYFVKSIAQETWINLPWERTSDI